MARFDYDRLGALIKESGKTKTHLCKVMGKSRYYLRDARKVGTNISGRELELLAGELGVSPEYLLGRTEKKTPAAPEKKARREIDGIAV